MANFSDEEAHKIANPEVLISSTQRENLILHEEGYYTDMTLPTGEDGTQPSDYCYLQSCGNYLIDMAAYIHAERRNFNWELAKKTGYRS